MDTRRLLIAVAAAALVPGCAAFGSPLSASAPAPEPVVVETAAALGTDMGSAGPARAGTGGRATTAPQEAPSASARSYAAVVAADAQGEVRLRGQPAIAAANAASRAASTRDGFVGGIQVFVWAPGRVFEVWTAPLRVTTLTLGPGETLVSRAAGDTVRWQVGEVVSGSGPDQRTHVLLKPLQRGLRTNLVLTTNRRLYLIDLKSGSADAFNAAVAWDEAPAGQDLSAPAGPAAAAVVEPAPGPDPLVEPEGPLDARYRIEPRGARPVWSPTAVFNDGRRTFIALDPEARVDETPVLFVIGAGGEPELSNYRQIGNIYVVDRLFDEAELRLGDRRPRIVRIRRLPGARR